MTQYITLSKFAKDITGQTFGRLTALGPICIKSGQVKWECRCDCGNTVIVQCRNLKSGHSKSCGCIVHDMLVQRNSTHGMAHSRTYDTWISMIYRCYVPTSAAYPCYGARGISICDEWRNSPQAFHDYVSELQNYGEKGYTLDRINNDGNYAPGNVRWATQAEQMGNTRDCHMVTYNGKTQCVTAWAKEFHMHPQTLRARLKKGRTMEHAINDPIKKGPLPKANFLRDT